jgi:hypothetical protein
MLETGARVTARGALVMVLFLPLYLAAGARAEEGGAVPPSSTLAAFEELYSRTTAEVADGGPAASVAIAAEEIYFSLKTKLIRSDAEIEVLKLEAARFGGERQLKALDGLVRAAATRERQLWQAIRQLEELGGKAAALPEETPPPAEEAGDVQAGKKGSIQISFEPQDVTTDPDP